MQRRGFLESTLAAFGGGLLAAFAAVPAALQVISPLIRKTTREEEWFSLGPLNQFSEEEHPTQRIIVVEVQDGWQVRSQNQAVFVVMKSNQPTVFSSVCPHLNCPVTFEHGEDKFHCPCHQSYWDSEGRRLAGPAARGLDPLPSKVEGEELFCRWVQYRPGLSEPVEV